MDDIPQLDYLIERGEGKVFPASNSQYAGARHFDNLIRANFRRKSDLHLMQQTQTANCCARGLSALLQRV
jgi:hypothetical protein